MMINKLNIFLATSFLILLSVSCIQEIPFETESFENALVITATITNEEKFQEIFISRTYRFEDNGPNPESNASVKVVGNGIEYIFRETDAGTYISEFEFSAQPNADYQLRIATQDGRVYTSTSIQLTAITQIDALYPVRETNDDGVNGMTMYIDSFDPTGNSQYYRYEYEETFKIVAPNYRDLDLIILNEVFPDCEVGFEPRPIEEKVCYRTEGSTDIILTNTIDLNEDRLKRYPIRFISSNDYKISHRYSIFVKQYTMNREVYEYLETLKNFATNSSLFSQIQQGYVGGNITSESNTSEKVIGFFEVSSVDEKRLFFDYEDYYFGAPLPPYAINCFKIAPQLFARDPNKFNHPVACGPIFGIIKARILVYLEENPNDTIFVADRPYFMVPRACGDCTVLGSSEPPEFWEE